MPFYDHDSTRIYYEDTGSGFPLLLLAPGGMRSSIALWSNAPWHPVDELSQHFRVIAMDQRNAGQSSAPVTAADGWHSYTADQLGLMDHLGIDQFHIAGMCIGGAFCHGLIDTAPDRIASAVLFQPIGRENNQEAFDAMFDNWSAELQLQRPEVDNASLAALSRNLFVNDRVLFSVDEHFLDRCTTPLCVLMGNDHFHPQSTSRLIAERAPDVLFIEYWKEHDHIDPARQSVVRFLQDHTPAGAGSA